MSSLESIVPRALENAKSISVDDTVGAVFMGLVFASILFGITSLQAYLYYHHFPNDTKLHKISVAVLWMLDSVHLGMLVHTSYHYGITNFGNIGGVAATIIWSMKLSSLINVVIILMVQSLYAFRVWLLGGYHRGFLGYFVAAVVAGGFIIGIVLVYSIYMTETFPQLTNISWAIDSSLAVATIIDFTIAGAMCYYLRKSKGKMSQLNSRISTIMQYSLSSGLLTSACSLSTLFTYTLLPNSLVFLALQSLSTKLYVGSFLCMLNARTPSDLQDKTSKSFQSTTSQLNIKTPMSGRSFGGSAPSSSTSETKRYHWDMEAQPELPHAPLTTYQLPPRFDSKPEYMRQW